MKNKTARFFWGLTRIGMGWIFFWAFIDKLMGLGFSTVAEKSWLAGGSPTMGFLKSGTYGPLAGTFQSFAGHPVVDFLFMAGLLGVGAALLLGVGVKVAGYSGTMMMALMYAAAMPPKTNPLLDDHIIYGLILLGFAFGSEVGETFGLGGWWKKQKLVKKNPILV